MKKIISMVLLCAAAFLPFAYAQGAEQLGDDLYKIDDITIKFNPPQGWAVKQGPVPSVHLNFQPRSDSSSLASLGVVTCAAPFAAGFDMEKLMKATETDKNISAREIIDFAGTKAFSSMSEMSPLKTRSIQFLKDGSMFTITFVADGKDFDALLPSIEESLKTFQVVSPTADQVQAQVASPARVSRPVAETVQVSVPAVAPAQVLNEPPPPAVIPVPLIAEPFQEKGRPDSVVRVCLKSGTMVKGKVLERSDDRLKVDFHGVPISVYLSDINTMDEIEPAAN